MDLLSAYGSDQDDSDLDEDGRRVSITATPPTKRAKLENGAVSMLSLPSAEALLSGLANGFATSTSGPQFQVPALTASGPGRHQQHQQTVPIMLSTELTLPPEPPKVRVFPHVEGNFATVVYIIVDAAAEAQLQQLAVDLISKVRQGTASITGDSYTAAARATAQNGTPGFNCDAEAVPSTLAEVSTNKAAVSSFGSLQLWPTFPWTTAAAAAAKAAPGTGAAATAPATATAAASGATAEQTAQDATDQQLPLHLSISRTVPIKKIQTDSLQAALTKQLKPLKSCKVQLQGLLCLVNDAATRSFVGIKVAAGEKQVVRMVEAVNRAFITHGLQTFYEDPLPHVSLAWTPGDQASRLQPWLDTVPHEPISLKVSQVVCQIGKVRHVVWQG